MVTIAPPVMLPEDGSMRNQTGAYGAPAGPGSPWARMRPLVGMLAMSLIWKTIRGREKEQSNYNAVGRRWNALLGVEVS
jgi:hypothetical protein